MGMTLAVFKPQSPPVIPNPGNVLEGLAATKAEIALMVPMFIEVSMS